VEPSLLEQLEQVIEPLLPGLVLGGLLILLLVGFRLILRRESIVDKLKLPSTLLTLYFVTLGLVVAASLYWKRVWVALHVISLLVLALAIVLALSFGVFDFFLMRYRKFHVPKIIRDLLVIVVYVIVAMWVLSSIGRVKLTGLLTGSAIVTAIIGFALQDLLSNIISGLALQMERPFKAGDWVMFGEQEGEILELNWRSTKIKTLHSDLVVVPNNVITKSSVINMSVPTPVHRRKLTIGLRYEAPPNRAKASIMRAVRGVDGVLTHPEPFVLVRSYDDFAITYRVHFFVNRLPQKERIEDRVLTRLWYQLKRDGLSIPFPIRDINVREIKAADEARAHELELDQIVASLRKVQFLEPLEEAELRKLARGIRVVYFAKSEVVIHEGDAGASFYIISDGEVEVCVGKKRQRVATLGPDDYFGEMSLMTGEQRSATVIATTDAELYEIGKATFKSLVEGNEALIDAIGEALERRRSSLRQSQEGIADPSTSDAADEQEHQRLVSRIRRFFGL
jgi:small-conductance mechanosensitive channel/CRP-like cAMP-binding protein